MKLRNYVLPLEWRSYSYHIFISHLIF